MELALGLESQVGAHWLLLGSVLQLLSFTTAAFGSEERARSSIYERWGVPSWVVQHHFYAYASSFDTLLHLEQLTTCLGEFEKVGLSLSCNCWWLRLFLLFYMFHLLNHLSLLLCRRGRIFLTSSSVSSILIYKVVVIELFMDLYWRVHWLGNQAVWWHT